MELARTALAVEATAHIAARHILARGLILLAASLALAIAWRVLL